MSTLAEIVADSRLQINQIDSTNSDFTDAQLKEFANQAIRFTAPKILYPRTSGNVAPLVSTKVYSWPTDFMHLLIAYYGNTAVSGGIWKLDIVTHERLAAIYPRWLEDVAENDGAPRFIMLLNRTQFVLFPSPNAANVTSGNQIRLYYANYPAEITSDSAVPDLPEPYHDTLSTYVAHLCYAGKLQNPKLSDAKLTEYVKKIEMIQMPTTQESLEWGFTFSGSDSPYLSDN